jgi:hypothetical protein
MEQKICACGDPACGKAKHDETLPCPVCGEASVDLVAGDTVRKLLRPGLPAAGDKYYVCSNPACDAVYFSKAGLIYKQADVTVPVFFKTGAEPVYACYCAGVTRAQVLDAVKKTGATRWSAIIKEITGAVPKCKCAEKNPLGKCCSENAYVAAIAESSAKPAPKKKSGPLHGVTLETILIYLVKTYGWEKMARVIPVRCFMYDPTVKSSLVFLRGTPWARAEVEKWYLHDRNK